MTTKPPLLPWATNDNHPAGGNPWSGQPTKVKPSAGQIATGWTPNDRPPAEFDNWRNYQVNSWLHAITAYQLRNWFLMEEFPTFSGDVLSGCYSAYNGRWYVLALGATPTPAYPYITYSVDDGRTWLTENTTSLIVKNANSVIDCSDTSAYRIYVTDQDTKQVWLSSAIDTWTLSNNGIGADASLVVAAWGGGDFIVSERTGTPPAAYVSDGETDSWDAIGAVTTYNATKIYAIRHTRDTDNPMWLIVYKDNSSNYNVLRSSNGTSWTNVSEAFTTEPYAAGGEILDYCPANGRWILCMEAAGKIAYSDDNGQTWTETTGNWSSYKGSVIRSNRSGGWVVGPTPASATGYFVSADNGDTWTRAYPPPVPGGEAYASAVVYGNGLYLIAHSDTEAAISLKGIA